MRRGPSIVAADLRAADAGHLHRRWPLRADPQRWPRLFANTTESTLSFDPVLRRYWWQRGTAAAIGHRITLHHALDSLPVSGW